MSDSKASVDLKGYAELFEKKGLTDPGEVALAEGLLVLLMGDADKKKPEQRVAASKLRNYFVNLMVGATGATIVLPNGDRPGKQECRRALEELFLPKARGRFARSLGLDQGGRPAEHAINDLIVKTFERMKKEAKEKGQRFRQMDAANALADSILPSFYDVTGRTPETHQPESLIRRYRRLRAKAAKVDKMMRR